MFCSKCGKTVEIDAASCPSCGAPLGENRFGGMQDYTSVQFIIAPGQTEFKPYLSSDAEPVKPYTRTNYSEMEDADQKNAPAERRTTYRPEYAAGSVSERVRRDMEDTFDEIDRRRMGAPEPEEAEEQDSFEEKRGRAYDISDEDVPLSEASREMMDEIREELGTRVAINHEELRAREITLTGTPGISEDVSEYIRRMEDGDAERRSTKKRRNAPVYDDYEHSEEEDAVADEGEEAPVTRRPGKIKAKAARSDESYEDEEAYVDDDYDDDDGEGGGKLAGIIKVVIAVVIAAALVFGVVKWVGNIKGSQSTAPIEGVTGSYYDAAVAMIKEHVSSDYIDQRMALYTGADSSSGAVTFMNAMNEDALALKALMPEEPAANDKTLETAVLKIQENIKNTVLMDSLAAADGTTPGTTPESSERWEAINNSIIQLESARSAAELTAITNGRTIELITTTPEPTIEPVTYSTLQKGDENNDVMRLQNRLYELGFLKDTRDGAFGSKTMTALKLFQEAAGLEATGIADPITQQKLFADDAPYAEGATTPVPGVTPAPVKEPEPEEAAAVPEGAEEI